MSSYRPDKHDFYGVKDPDTMSLSDFITYCKCIESLEKYKKPKRSRHWFQICSGYTRIAHEWITKMMLDIDVAHDVNVVILDGIEGFDRLTIEYGDDGLPIIHMHKTEERVKIHMSELLSSLQTFYRAQLYYDVDCNQFLELTDRFI